MSCFPVPAPLPDGASEGAVACRVWLTLDADEACVAARGWLDPLDEDGERRIRKVERDGQERRLCEVRQLEGAALQSCRLDPGCSECSAGWCLRDRWTDEQADEWSVRNEGSFCDPEPSPAVALPQFRFTGASDRADGQLEIVCDH